MVKDFDKQSTASLERQRPVAKLQWMPAVESHLDGDRLVVKAELPGIDPKAVSLSVAENQLTITGERQPKEPSEQHYLYQERAFGKFAPTISLPRAVDLEKATTHYQDGVFEVTFPLCPQEPRAASA